MWYAHEVTLFIKVTFVLVLLIGSCGAQSFPQNYAPAAHVIINESQNTNLERFSYLCDTFGPRYVGTPALDAALAWIVEQMKDDGLNVTMEPVKNITNWIRGQESLVMLSPRLHTMSILGLGTSVGTPAAGITASAFVVTSFDDLNMNATKAAGKIVVYNVPFTDYGDTVSYRVLGASQAARVGAVAALVRSITPYSLNTPHTGVQRYQAGVPAIPVAAITVEDAELMYRMQARGQNITLQLKMEAHTGPTVSAYNILADLTGATDPQEIVVMGGHTDSWDVGTGCMDDGGGLFSAWEALARLWKLVQSGALPRPRRTIRALLWVDEEVNQMGGRTYALDYAAQLQNHIIAFESDTGNFMPTGFGFSGSEEAANIMTQIGTLLSSISAGNITYGPEDGADTDNGFLFDAGVPAGVLLSAGFDPSPDPASAYYFNYHHSQADTFTAINPAGVINSVAAFGVMTYVLADMPQRLPTNLTTSPSVFKQT